MASSSNRLATGCLLVVLSFVVPACDNSEAVSKPSSVTSPPPQPPIPAALPGQSGAVPFLGTNADQLATFLDTVRAPQFDPTPIQLTPGDRSFEPVGELTFADARVTGLSFSGNGERLIAATDKGALSIWEVGSAREVQRFEQAASQSISALDVTFDGKQAIGAVGERGILWDLTTGKQSVELVHGKPVTAIAITPDGRLAVSAVEQDTLWYWDATRGQRLQLNSAVYAPGKVRHLRVAPDGRWVMRSVYDRDVQIFDLPELKGQHHSPIPKKSTFQASWSNSDHSLLAFVCEDGAVVVQDQRQPAPAPAEPLKPRITMCGSLMASARAIGVLPGNDYVLVYGGGTQAEYRKLPGLDLAGRYRDEVQDVVRVAISPDARYCASADKDGRVRIWRLPGPGITEPQRTFAFCQRVNKLLVDKRFDDLDSLQHDLVKSREYSSTGMPRLQIFYTALSQSVLPADPTSAVMRLKLLEDWLATKPQSSAARVALSLAANAMAKAAAQEHGKSMSLEEAQQMPWFEAVKKSPQLLVEAQKMARQQNVADPHIYLVGMLLSGWLNQPRSELTDLCDLGLNVDPAYLPLMQLFAEHVTPCQIGIEGEAAKFALACAARSTSEEEALMFYGAIGAVVGCQSNPTQFGNNGFDLKQLRAGAKLLIQRFPESNLYLQFACMLACIENDKAGAKELMSLAGPVMAANIWGGEDLFDKYRTWCFTAEGSEAKLAVQAHAYPATDLSWSADGKKIATVSSDLNGQLKIWDAESGQLVRTVPGRDYLKCVAISPDDRWLALGGGEIRGFFEVWDFASLKPVLESAKFSRPVTACRFSSAGLLAVAAADGRLKVWRPTEDDAVFEFSSADTPQTVSFSPDGKRLAIGTGNSQVSLFDLSRQAEVEHFASRGGLVRSAMSASAIAVASDFASVEVFSLADKLRAPWALKGFAVALSPSGKLLAVGARENNIVEIWDVGTRTKLKGFAGHKDFVTNVVFSPDGRRLASSGRDGMLYVWDLADYQSPTLALQPDKKPVVASPPPASSNERKASNEKSAARATSATADAAPPPAVLLAEDGHWPLGDLRIAAPAKFPPIQWSEPAAEAELLAELDHAGEAVSAAAISADGKLAVTGTKQGTLCVWSVSSGQPVQRFPHAATNSIDQLAIAPDGRLAVGSVGRLAFVWDLSSGHQISKFKGHAKAIGCLAFGGDCRIVASGSRDGALRLWNAETAEPLDDEPTQRDFVWTAVGFSPDMKLCVAGAMDGSVVLESLPAHKLQVVRSDNHSPVQAVSFSPDGSSYATAFADGSVLVQWLDTAAFHDATRGTILAHGRGFSAPVSEQRTIQFLGDGQTILAYSGPGRFDYCQLQIGLVGRHYRPAAAITCTAASAMGPLAIDGYADGKAKLWKLPGPQVSEALYEARCRKRLRNLLADLKYEELEKIYQRALASRRLRRSGTAELSVFYDVLSWQPRVDSQDRQGKQLIAALQKWADEQPKSVAALVAIAHSRATLARVAQRQDTAALHKLDEAVRPGQEHLTAASRALERAEELVDAGQTADPLLFAVAARIAELSGASPAAVGALYERALEIDPLFLPIVQRAAAYKLQTCGKDVEAVHKFATAAASRADSKNKQLQVLAAAAAGLYEARLPIDHRQLGFSMPDLQKGVTLLRRGFPESVLYDQFGVLLAAMSNDPTVADEFDRLGAGAALEVWGTADGYQRLRARALAGPPKRKPLMIDVGWQPILSVSSNEDGKLLLVATAAARTGVAIYSTTDGQRLQTWPSEHEVLSATLHPAGKTIGLAAKIGDTYYQSFWDLENHTQVGWWRYWPEALRHCAYSPLGDLVAVVDQRQTQLVDKDPLGARIRFVTAPTFPAGTQFSIAPAQQYLAIAGDEGRVVLSPLAEGFVGRNLAVPAGPISHVVAGNEQVAIARPGHGVTLFAVAGGEPSDLHTAAASSLRISALAIAPDDRRLAVATVGEGGAARIELWDLSSKRLVDTIPGHANPVTQLHFLSKDRLVSASNDGMVCVWDCKPVNEPAAQLR